DDYTISFTKRATVIGDGGGFDIQPITIIPETRPVPNPSDTGTETSIADIPLNRPYQIPSGGLCMKVAEGLCISVFGDSVTVHNVTKIDPNQFKVLLCNQTYLEAFEINVTADNVYLCFDTTTVDTKAVSIYSFNGDWNQLTNITQIGNQICGRITSTPYMVAGFKSSDLQQLALDAIADSEKRLLTNSDSELENILNQAKDAYYNCDYQNAYDLSQKIFWSSTISGIQLPLITTFGPANTILEMMIYSLVAKLLGYETVYIDLLPIFDLSNPGKLDFRYITPVIGVVPSGTGNLYEEIESDEIVNPDIYKDRQDV
ncbi:MAG: hypothetical protein KJ697_00005, partial [Nanoarchaeota archaeon]|nr:hypothetical protein [Nanoarchaeota archaeon]